MTHGFLTRRLDRIRAEAPYPDYSSNIYRIVFAAISRAWQMLLDEEGEAIGSHGEVYTTTSLHEQLEELRRANESNVPGFTGEVFETVHRDASLPSHEGQHLEKQPDLTFRLVARNPGESTSHYRGIFIECKLVEREKYPVRLYCRKGIRRFVEGEYAWAMPTGTMVAYTRGDCTIENDLRPFLEKHQDQSKDPFLTKQMPEPWKEGDTRAEIYSSVHGRSHCQAGQPGDIKLHHLWLRSPETGMDRTA